MIDWAVGIFCGIGMGVVAIAIISAVIEGWTRYGKLESRVDRLALRIIALEYPDE